MSGFDRLSRSGVLIAVLKQIVRAERIRAEQNPLNSRNVDLGIVDNAQTKEEAYKQILELFNEIEELLNHLHISRLAAAFEAEAKARLGTVIGESRSAIKKARKHHGAWAQNLVRSTESFEGLRDIEHLLGNDTGLKPIRDCRNNFSHGGSLSSPPPMQDAEALELLAQALAAIR